MQPTMPFLITLHYYILSKTLQLTIHLTQSSLFKSNSFPLDFHTICQAICSLPVLLPSFTCAMVSQCVNQPLR